MTYPGGSTFPSGSLYPSGALTGSSSGRTKLVNIGGYLFDDQVGVRFSGLRLSGWDNAVGSSLQLTQKPRQPGAWRSNSPQRRPRTIVFEGIVSTASTDLMIDTIDAINAAAAPLDETLIVVDAHGKIRWSMVSVQDDPIITDYPTPLVKRFSIQLAAADPRKFADPLTDTTLLPASTGGLTIPFTIPFTINATTISGQCFLTNPGNTNGPVLLRIDGPCAGPVITHVATGAQLVFASTLSLGAGEWLDVDMENERAVANGTADRAGYVTQRGWSQFEPGLNQWAFTAAAYNPAARLTVTANPAWL